MFCPFVSTPEKEVECKENCRFRFKDMEEDEFKCEINYIAEKVEELTNSLLELKNRFD